MDLLDFFRGVHPWTKLYRLLPQLPALSQYKRAVVDDPDLAARVAEGVTLADLAAKPEASLRDYSEVDRLGDRIVNEIRVLGFKVQMDYLGKKTPKPNIVEYPVSEQQRAIARKRAELLAQENDALEAVLAPRD